MSNRRTKVVSKEKSTSKGDKTTSADNQFGTRLARGFDILRTFKRADEFLSNKEIGERMDLSVPTVSRLTYTLVQLGYLHYSERYGLYRLGLGILELARPFFDQAGLRAVLRPKMRELADETGLSVSIGEYSAGRMVYTDIVRGASPVVLDIAVGSSIEVSNTALGRAYLGAIEAPALNQMIERHSDALDCKAAELKAVAANARSTLEEQGYCTSLGEWHQAVNAAAVPLIFPALDDVVVIVCAGPSTVMPADMISDVVGPRLKSIAEFVRAQASLEE